MKYNSIALIKIFKYNDKNNCKRNYDEIMKL